MIKFSDLEQMAATIQLAKIKFAVISYISNVTTIKLNLIDGISLTCGLFKV